MGILLNRKNKALLFNLLLCPGVGQLVLRRYKRATLFITIFLVTTLYFISSVASKLQPMVDKVMTGKLLLTQHAIAEEMSLNPIQFDLILGQRLLVIILVVWLVAIIDGIRIDREN